MPESSESRMTRLRRNRAFSLPRRTPATPAQRQAANAAASAARNAAAAANARDQLVATQLSTPRYPPPRRIRRPSTQALPVSRRRPRNNNEGPGRSVRPRPNIGKANIQKGVKIMMNAYRKKKADAMIAETRSAIARTAAAMNARTAQKANIQKGVKILQQIAHNVQQNALQNEWRQRVRALNKAVESGRGQVELSKALHIKNPHLGAGHNVKIISLLQNRPIAAGIGGIGNAPTLNRLKQFVSMMSVNNKKFQNSLASIKTIHRNKYSREVNNAPTPPNRKNYETQTKYQAAKRQYNSNIKNWITTVGALWYKNKLPK